MENDESGGHRFSPLFIVFHRFAPLSTILHRYPPFFTVSIHRFSPLEFTVLYSPFSSF
jgi:hypothetical protein